MRRAQPPVKGWPSRRASPKLSHRQATP